MLKSMNSDTKEIGALAQMGTYMSTKINISKDDSHSHIAEMIIQGSTMGITDVTKHINKYDEADIDIVKLAKRLLKIEEQNIEEMKPYL
ncbi:hypothetical protein D3C71_1875730 [compost metagenome]